MCFVFCSLWGLHGSPLGLHESRKEIWTVIHVKLIVSASVTRYNKMTELGVFFASFGNVYEAALGAFRLQISRVKGSVVLSLCLKGYSGILDLDANVSGVCWFVLKLG